MSELFLCAYALATFYTLTVGFFVWTPSVASSICQILFLLLVYYQMKKSTTFVGIRERVECALGLILAAVPAYYTNSLVQTISWYTYLLLCLTFLVVLATHEHISYTPGSMIYQGAQFVRAAFLRALSILRAIFSIGNAPKCADGCRALLVSALPLLIFHLLFEQINESYSIWTRWIMSLVFDLDVWRSIVQCLLQGSLAFVLVSTRFELQKLEDVPSHLRQRSIGLGLFSLIILFSIFAAFQSSSVASTPDVAQFKALSLYVQRGFWQLIWVGILGGSVWVFSRQWAKSISTQLNRERLLLLFLALLVLVTIFTLHKVVLLQFVYGLKDTRIYATLAALLIGLATCNGFWCLNDSSRYERTAQRIWLVAILSIATLSSLNVERCVTAIHPIRYFSSSTPFNDLSYLLGNSFDNLGSWETLMNESMRSGIPKIDDYYWGDYQALCSRGEHDRNSQTYLRGRNATIVEKYGKRFSSLGAYGQFHLGEWLAYRWLLRHQEVVDRFLAFVEKNCQ